MSPEDLDYIRNHGKKSVTYTEQLGTSCDPLVFESQDIKAAERFIKIVKKVGEALQVERGKVIYVEEVPFDEAEAKVVAYLKEKKEAYSSDVAAACNLDIETVLKVFAKLREEGKLEW